MLKDLRVMIVEDEPLATRRLVKLLKPIAGVNVVATAQNGREALDIIEAVSPNLLLLDIQMPGINGFDLLEQIPESINPAVIFITAFDSYAVEAFGVHAVDFVLKPVVPERLQSALDQARKDLEARRVEQKLAELYRLRAELQREKAAIPSPYAKELWVRQRTETIRLSTQDIDWIEAEKDYVRIHSGERSYFHHGMIGTIEERLDPDEFMRVHRSSIVRLDRIHSILRGRYGALDVQLTPGTTIRVGRKYAASLKIRLEV